MKLAVVVVNYRTPAFTIECLQSMQGELETDDILIVVDNCSSDGSAECIAKAIQENEWSSWSRLICSPVNGGFAAGNNLGIKSVAADAYLLLNSDTIVERGTIACMRRAMEDNPTVGLVAPWLEDGDGRKGVAAFRFQHPMSEFIRSARTGLISRLLRRFDVVLDQHEAASADWVGFACVLVRREVMDEIGLLDEGYFMYFEDVDYCRRARKAGWKILCVPAARVIHHLSGSSHAFAAAERKRVPRYYYESRSRYFAKFYGLGGLWMANGLWCGGRCVSMLRELIGNLEPPHCAHEAHDIWINAWMPFHSDNPGERSN